MKFGVNCLSLFALLSISARVLAAPAPIANPVPAAGDDHDHSENEIDGEYIAIINNTDTRPWDEIFAEMGVTKGNSEIIATGKNPSFRWFVGEMSKHCVKRMGEMSAVELFEKKMEMRALVSLEQSTAPWGLQRISVKEIPEGTPTARQQAQVVSRTFSYVFDDTHTGEGVNVYVIDSGILADHVDFEGRARNVFPSEDVTDDNGHGTHCAGTIGAGHLGVAKRANILGVKVLNRNGGGSTSTIISGLNFIAEDHIRRSRQPGFRGSVMSMSLGSESRTQIIERFVQAVSDAGVHVAVAAGNESKDACLVTPGAMGTIDSNIVSVGAIDIEDNRPAFSNFGRCVSIYAPGANVLSTFINERNPDVRTFLAPLSGTSMATPHVAGVMAGFLSAYPQLRDDPAALKASLLRTAVPSDRLANIRGDPAIILNNGIKRVL